MKNIEKKWLLFIISTVVTFCGIGYSLIKGTQAADTQELVDNLTFSDIKFYECIVDTYNEKNNTDIAYDAVLTDEQLSSITTLTCADKGITSIKGIGRLSSLNYLSVSKNQLVELDLSGNLLLETLYAHSNQLEKLNITKNELLKEAYLSNNKLVEVDLSNNLLLEKLEIFDNNLTGLDVSGNTLLTELNIKRPPFLETYYVYKGNTFNLGMNVKIPSNLNFDNPIWESEDSSLATVDNGVATAIESGTVVFHGNANELYKVTNVLNIVEITSDKYIISEKNNYIYVGLDDDVNTIKNNISLSNEKVSLDVDLVNNKVLVKYEDKILKEFLLCRFNVNKYEMIDKEIVINEKISYEEFFNDVVDFNDKVISYKLYDLNGKVIESKIVDHMILKLYDGDILLDTYHVYSYYLDFSQDIVVDSENKILKNISAGKTVNDVLNLIDTSGDVLILDNNGNLVDSVTQNVGTGYRAKIKVDNVEFMYTISVLGDVNGDGIIGDDDALIISRHIIQKNVINLMDYLLAADYDNNGEININDVIKLKKYIETGGNNE